MMQPKFPPDYPGSARRRQFRRRRWPLEVRFDEAQAAFIREQARIECVPAPFIVRRCIQAVMARMDQLWKRA